MQLIEDAGYCFTQECASATQSDGISCLAAYFASSFNIYDEKAVTNGIKEFVSYR